MKGINEKKMNLTNCHNSRSKCPITWKEQFLRQKGLCRFMLRNGALRLFLYHDFLMALSKRSKVLALFPSPFLPPPLSFPSCLLLLVLLCPSPPKLYLYLDKPSKGAGVFWVSTVGPAPQETLWIACGFCNQVPHTQELRTTRIIVQFWRPGVYNEWKQGWKQGVRRAVFLLGVLGILPSFPQFLELSCIS